MVREKSITASFHVALTVGGPGGVPKPIEFHAHDAQRYVGDIFAWLHQAVVAERELFEGLLGLASSAESRRSSVQSPTTLAPLQGLESDQETLMDALNKSTQGVCKLLIVHGVNIASYQAHLHISHHNHGVFTHPKYHFFLSYND